MAVISLPGSQPTGPCMKTGRYCWTVVNLKVRASPSWVNSHPIRPIPRRVTATGIRLTIVPIYTGMVCGWSWSKTGLTVRTAKVTSGSTPVTTSSVLSLTSRTRSSRMIMFRKVGRMIFLALIRTTKWNGRANV